MCLSMLVCDLVKVGCLFVGGLDGRISLVDDSSQLSLYRPLTIFNHILRFFVHDFVLPQNYSINRPLHVTMARP